MPDNTPSAAPHDAPKTTAVLVLGDGSVFYGAGIGVEGETLGEVCFNTGMTGYQEILTDPSYAGQIITFTFPHIGNVGANGDDREGSTVAARGLVLREAITEPANWRATQGLQAWLVENKVVGISGIDTRALTQRIRDGVPPTGVIAYNKAGNFDIPALQQKARQWGGLTGLDLVPEVTCAAPYGWDEPPWGWGESGQPIPAGGAAAKPHVVAIDYGAKRNILRCLVKAGARVTVVPASTGFAAIIALKPDGVFLSNGPGDPAATGLYAVPVIQQLIASNIPIFGICLGHQLLALALGGSTEKMPRGHRGANQPVKDLASGRVEITSQNHGFCVVAQSLPPHATITHTSLFDGSNEGLALQNAPVFSVQYHPEASPGPEDSHYLFTRFMDSIAGKAAER